jgi:hypothetical protein
MTNNSGPAASDPKAFVVQEFQLDATVVVDTHLASKGLFSWSGPGKSALDASPWNQCYLTGSKQVDRIIPLRLTDISQSLDRGYSVAMGSKNSAYATRFREMELRFEGISGFGHGMSTNGLAYSAPQEAHAVVMDPKEVEQAAIIAADSVAAKIPAHVQNRDYLVEIARAAALEGAKLAFQALRGE